MPIQKLLKVSYKHLEQRPVFTPPGSAGRTPVTSNPSRPGMGRPDIIVNDKPQAPAPSEPSDSKN